MSSPQGHISGGSVDSASVQMAIARNSAAKESPRPSGVVPPNGWFHSNPPRVAMRPSGMAQGSPIPVSSQGSGFPSPAVTSSHPAIRMPTPTSGSVYVDRPPSVDDRDHYTMPMGAAMGQPPMTNQPMGSQPMAAQIGGQPMGAQMGGQPMGGQAMGGQPMGGQPMGAPGLAGQPMGGPGMARMQRVLTPTIMYPADYLQDDRGAPTYIYPPTLPQ